MAERTDRDDTAAKTAAGKTVGTPTIASPTRTGNELTGSTVGAHRPDFVTDRHISIAAYYRAEQRGFAPGHELEDWLEAEQELMLGAGAPMSGNKAPLSGS